MTGLLFSTLLLFLFACSTAQYTVSIRRLGRIVQRCEASGANFGEDVTPFSFGPIPSGCALTAAPEEACAPVKINTVNGTTCHTNYAVVPWGKCDVSEKAYFVQDATPRAFDALIVYYSENESPPNITGGKYAEEVRIPVVMIGYDCMKDLLERYPAADGFEVQIYETPGLAYLLQCLMPAFAFLISFYIGHLLCRFGSDCWRVVGHRISRWRLERLFRTTKTYVIGDEPDTCVICIVKFVEGEQLRALPCRHLFHCDCIDRWLTENRMVCPLCMLQLGPDPEPSADEQERIRAAAARVIAEYMDNLPSTINVPHRAREEGKSSNASSSASTSSELLADVEGAGGEGAAEITDSPMYDTFRSLHSFLERMTASSSRMQAGERGEENAGFEDNSDTEYGTPPTSPVGDNSATAHLLSASIVDEMTNSQPDRNPMD